MKLPIKHYYFQLIKDGKKDYEYRDAHITFVDEDTGEQLRKEVFSCSVIKGEIIKLQHPDVLSKDENIIRFTIAKR